MTQEEPSQRREIILSQSPVLRTVVSHGNLVDVIDSYNSLLTQIISTCNLHNMWDFTNGYIYSTYQEGVKQGAMPENLNDMYKVVAVATTAVVGFEMKESDGVEIFADEVLDDVLARCNIPVETISSGEAKNWIKDVLSQGIAWREKYEQSRIPEDSPFREGK